MKFVAIRDFRTKSSQIWKELAQEREMVITSNGRPIAVLSAVGEEEVEETLEAFRRFRAVKAVVEMQNESVKRGTDRLSPEEIESEIKAVRSGREA